MRAENFFILRRKPVEVRGVDIWGKTSWQNKQPCANSLWTGLWGAGSRSSLRLTVVMCFVRCRWMCPKCRRPLICHKLSSFQGYDISFLITNFHTEQMYKHKLVDFVIHFMEEIDKEISEMKLSVNARARIVAEEFLKNVSPFFFVCLSWSWCWFLLSINWITLILILCWVFLSCSSERLKTTNFIPVFIMSVPAWYHVAGQKGTNMTGREKLRHIRRTSKM